MEERLTILKNLRDKRHAGWKAGDWEQKRTWRQQKEKHKCLFLCYLLTFISTYIYRVINGPKKIFISLGLDSEFPTIYLTI